MSVCSDRKQVPLEKLFEPSSPPMTNLIEQLDHWAEVRPDENAYIYLQDGETASDTWTFRRLQQRVRAVAAELTRRNLQGERILLLHPPCIGFIDAFFGCQFAGAIPVPAFPPRKSRNGGRIDLIAEDADAKLVLTNRDTADRMRFMVEETKCLKDLPLLATEEIPDESALEYQPANISNDDIALLQYTSGSTGSPKGVVLTHDNLIENCKMITRAFSIFQYGSGLSWLPTYHDMGLVGGILNPLFIGRKSVLMPPLTFLAKPSRWLRAISEFDSAIAGGPNFAYQLCIDKIPDEEMQGVDLSHWEVAFNGAEPIRPETLEAFNQKFGKFGFKPTGHYPCYGMAETTLLVTGGFKEDLPDIRLFDRNALEQYKAIEVDEDDPNARQMVSCGRVQPDEKIIIVDANSFEELEEGQIGEIWISGVTVGKGYWNKPDETRECFQATLRGGSEDFLRTGDLGFFSKGQLFVTGRLKDLIIVRGVNRYPQDIEATVEKCTDRLQNSGTAAFALEVDGRERLVIVSETQRSREKDWSDVIDHVRKEVTAEHDLPPDAVVMVRTGSIQKTSSGKIQRHACKRAFQNGTLKIIDQWIGWINTREGRDGTAEEIEAITSAKHHEINEVVYEIVVDQIRSVARDRANKLDLNTNIVIDLGLDSLERLQIASNLEQVYGARFPDEDLQQIETVREVVEAIQNNFDITGHSAPGKLATPTAKRIDGEIPDEFYRFDKTPEVVRFQKEKSKIDSSDLRNPFFSVHEGMIAAETTIDGRSLVSFASYNYLGLNGHPDVQEAGRRAIDRYGTSVSASRLVSGEKVVHKELEAALTDFLGFEDTILLTGGHATNQSIIGHIVSRGDLILHDSLAHNSIIQGAFLSGATRRPFQHNDWRALDETLSLIRRDYRRVLIAIEGLYSMDGDYPNIKKFIDVKNRHKCMLYVDEAHSYGTLGKNGRGITELYGVSSQDIEFCMGTISKAFASFGGFIGGSKAAIEYLRYTTPGFVFAAGLAPSSTAAALEALNILKREPERVAKLAANSELFLTLAKESGLDTGPSHGSPIVPVITGDSVKALKLSEGLFNAGINAQPILHPAVEEDRARVRFFITSVHSEEQIRHAVQTTTALCKELDAIRQ